MRYRIDPRASRVTVRAFASGALSAFGHNPSFAVRDVDGEIQYDPGAPDAAAVKVVVRAASLALMDNVSDKDRREIERVANEDVLETSAHPEIVYDCPADAVTLSGGDGGPLQASLTGRLTLHGVTRPQPLTARVFVAGDSLRGQGEVTLRPSDYRIRTVSVAGGMLKSKDEVRLSFDLVARP